VTIATAFFTALVGIVGTFTAANSSYRATVSQQVSENERSSTEFLRSKRQEAYTAFANEATATYQALLDANNLILPDYALPTLEDFNGVHRDVQSHIEKVSAAFTNLELVASEDVCETADDWEKALLTAANEHVHAALPYVTGRKPRDDDYRKLWMTDKDLYPLFDMFRVFTRAAREDLTDPELRKPAKNCPKAQEVH